MNRFLEVGMFSRRAGHALVRLLRSSPWYYLAAIVIAALALGVSEISAKILTPTLLDVTSTNVATVSAASFENTPVAPDSIVAAFGTQLATQTTSASDADPNTPGIQLPTTLAGTTVEVNGRPAGLFFVSPNQVNYVIPSQTEDGVVNVVVRSGDGTTSTGTVQVARVAPAIFAANANGRGVAAAQVIRFKTDGSQSYESVFEYNQAVQRYLTKPIDLGPDGERLFLVLFLSGIRRADDPNSDGSMDESVRVLIGGNEVAPLYAGRQPDFVGLDQINVEIPRSLIGRGVVNLSVSATGFTSSNLADIEIAGAPGNSPPQVSGFGAAALAGQTLTISGTGFSSIPAENIVRISGLDAQVMSASASQLVVMVPFGVESGTVSVRTALGEGVSPSILPVRTSVSGTVENTSRQPMSGVAVKVAESTITAMTNEDGAFVLPDVPAGVQFVEIDGGSLQTDPPYPKVTLKISAQSNRDNQFSRPIALQQAIGSGGTIGGSSFGGETLTSGESPSANLAAERQAIVIQTGDFQLQFPDNVKPVFPNGATSGLVYLTPLKDARTPVDLPYAYYSKSIVQITPFNVKLDQGGKLILPNLDGFPAGAPALLFRYDSESGGFVREATKAMVSADGSRIETEPGAIKVTSYYFAAVLRQTTTITGRVLERDRKTPVAKAFVRFRGQEALTDGNGGYVLRYVPVKKDEEIAVEVSYLRSSGRVDRVQSTSVPAIIGGITKVPDVILGDDKENRPPTILASPKIEIEEGKNYEFRFTVSDPDANQTVRVSVEGARFASVARGVTSTISAYVLRLTPGYADAGDYTLVLTAADSAGATARQEISLSVKNVNRAPNARDISVAIDEDTTANIKLEAVDPDDDPLTYSVVTPPSNGDLSGDPPSLVYKPKLNFNGADQFTFKANDGTADSRVFTVAITVRPVNDPPVISTPDPQMTSEGKQICFAVSASDPDVGQRLTISTVNELPLGATLTQESPTSVQFTWTPNFSQAGAYTIIFKATDSGSPQLSDMKEVAITVADTRLLNAPQSQKVNEGQSLIMDISAPSPDGKQFINITAEGLPEGATMSAQTLAGRRLIWTPNFTQAGNYRVKFKAVNDGPLAVDESVDVTFDVFDVQRDLAKEPAPLSIFGAAGRLPESIGDDGDAFGSSIAIGDLNGDGLPDLAIGATDVNDGGLNSGQVYIFFGRKSMEGTIDLADGAADVTLIGEAAEDSFGESLAIGDINGDGKNDLIVGAPLADNGDVPDAGKVYGVSGNLAAGSFGIGKVAGLTIPGGGRSVRFGESVAVGFFHTKNGPAADLMVGAPGYRAVQVGNPTPVEVGAVFGFFGGEGLKGTIDAARVSSLVLVGTRIGGQLGETLAVGNFNGDDFADLAIGAPLADKDRGAIVLFLGSKDLSLTPATRVEFTGIDEGDNFGSALAMGDLDNDGKSDLIVGAPGGDGSSNSQQDAGEVYVIYGVDNLQGEPADLKTHARATIFGVGEGDDEFPEAIGSSLAVGDFTGDGIPDLAVGSPGKDSLGAARMPSGAVYLVFGAEKGLTGSLELSLKTADMTIFGADSGDFLGLGAVAFGQINGSDVNGLILGMPMSSSVNNLRSGAGEVRAIWGVKR
jgi:uncharacterized protein (TIGR03437 family)